jgi:S-adenosylmethionine:tRNA ribosyltransferase-isomerase
MEPAMRVDDFDYHLPEELIALRPAKPRRAARMLVARGAETLDSVAERLAEFLDPGDLLIFNDTRVIPARLFGERRRATGDGTGVAKVEALLTRQTGRDAWRALARPGKRLAPGDRLRFGALEAEIVEKGDAGEVALRFDRGGPALDRAIAQVGSTPLPPYIAAKRAADAADAEDYQTIFADKPGSVAAPTASLHFDDVLIESLAAKGVKRAEVTLHVGAGTFLPVKAEQVADHRMHAEWGRLDADAAAAVNAARAAGKRVIPGRNDGAAAAGERRGGGRRRALHRRDRDLHHARLPVPRGGRADDEFPPAEIDPDDAGLGADGPRAHPRPLRPCDPRALPVL